MKIKGSNVYNLLTLILIGVGSIIGSGWLFAAYYGATVAGPGSIFSWIIGASLILLLALLLAELGTMFPVTGLFGRLIAISHNKDMGFITAVSNLICIIILIPLEAEATVQYISTVIPSYTPYLFYNSEFTVIGTLIVTIFILIYILINFWGIRSLRRINNVITIFKIIVPISTAIIIMCTAFAIGNFVGHKETFLPYGSGSIFTAIINCGIFYAFCGFPAIVAFSSEIKNSKIIIPLALICCIGICLAIYLLLQIAFIGAIPASMLKGGWGGINFTSPLAQLAQLLGLHVLMIILYTDACISPSGTGIVYMGAGTRFITAMAEDKELPEYFGYIDPKYLFSRRALIGISFFCLCLIWFFKNWRSIVILITVAQIVACLGIPLAFSRLRIQHPKAKRPFKMKLGIPISLLIYLFLTYLIIIAELKAVFTNFILLLFLFFIYTSFFYRHNKEARYKAWFSAWSMFVYLIITSIISYFYHTKSHKILYSYPGFLICLTVTIILFFLMVYQKNYNK